MSHHSAEFGAILYEHVGRIIMAFDGEEKHVLDLAEELQEIEPPDEFSASEIGFIEWRKLAKKQRLKLGLPI